MLCILFVAAKCKLLRLEAEIGHLAVTMPPPAGSGNSVSSTTGQAVSNQSAPLPASGIAAASSSSAAANRKKGSGKSMAPEVAPLPSKTPNKAVPASTSSKVPPRPQQSTVTSSNTKIGGQQSVRPVSESPPSKTPVFSHPSQVQALPSTVFKLNVPSDASKNAPIAVSSSVGNTISKPS
jgi:hypothetical protein